MSQEPTYSNYENELPFANQSYTPIEFQEQVPRDHPESPIELDDEDIEQLVRQHGVRPEVIQKQQENKLKDLSKETNKTKKVNTKNNSISNLSMQEIGEGVALVVINIMNDLLYGKPFIETFTKNNRLIFLGIFVVIFVALITIVNFNECGDPIVSIPSITTSTSSETSELSKLNTNLEKIIKQNKLD